MIENIRPYLRVKTYQLMLWLDKLVDFPTRKFQRVMYRFEIPTRERGTFISWHWKSFTHQSWNWRRNNVRNGNCLWWAFTVIVTSFVSNRLLAIKYHFPGRWMWKTQNIIVRACSSLSKTCHISVYFGFCFLKSLETKLKENYRKGSQDIKVIKHYMRFFRFPL